MFLVTVGHAYGDADDDDDDDGDGDDDDDGDGGQWGHAESHRSYHHQRLAYPRFVWSLRNRGVIIVICFNSISIYSTYRVVSFLLCQGLQEFKDLGWMMVGKMCR